MPDTLDPRPLPILSSKIETEFYLIVERGKLRDLQDYQSLDRLLGAAADYASGEFDGRVIGALELTYCNGLLQSAVPVTDLSGRVQDVLNGNPDWRKRQASAERWKGRDAA